MRSSKLTQKAPNNTRHAQTPLAPFPRLYAIQEHRHNSKHWQPEFCVLDLLKSILYRRAAAVSTL